MTTNGNGNYTWNRGISPEQLLSNAYQTIGKDLAEELGLHCTGSKREGRNEVLTFDMRHDKHLERTVGNIMVKVFHPALNSSKFEDVEGNDSGSALRWTHRFCRSEHGRTGHPTEHVPLHRDSRS